MIDTRTGQVWGETHDRKRQVEFIHLLNRMERELPEKIRTLHIVMDNVRRHQGKQVLA